MASATTDNTPLRIFGDADSNVDLTVAELESLAGDLLVSDASTIAPNRRGHAIPLGVLLDLVKPSDTATHLTLHASKDGFAASIPLLEARERSFVIFSIDGLPLTPAEGGPFRFLISDAAECHMDQLDSCANVKFLDAIEITKGKGKDTRYD